MSIAGGRAMFDFDKDENIAISHDQVKLTAFHVMVLRD
jgi:hypothetical protein